MPLTGEFLTVDDPRWVDLLREVPHDFYHRPGYVRLCADEEGGEPVAFLARHGGALLLVPMLVRPLPSELGDVPGSDATSPYGYPSPLLHGWREEGEVCDLLAAFAAGAAERGIVSGFFRLHPLLPLPEAPLRARGALVPHGETVVIDLHQTDGEMWSATRSSSRPEINRLIREGFRTTFDDWGLDRAFRTIYDDTMARVGAADFYRFSDDYFDGLRAALGEDLHLACVLGPDGEVAAGGLFTESCGIVQYHLGGTHADALRMAPTKLMFHDVRRWARDRGWRWLHLGGGIGGRSDSLFRFKAGFSNERRTFSTYRMILDPERYARLEELHGGAADPSDPDAFFPSYRAPVPAGR